MYLATPTDIYTEEQIKYGEWISENTLINSTFLTFSSTEQPVASIAGRNIFMGYDGWITSHGLEYSNRVFLKDKLFKSPYLIKDFENYNINYVNEDFGNSTFNAEDYNYWEIIFENEFHRVWYLNKNFYNY